jgi:hypothetical protein
MSQRLGAAILVLALGACATQQAADQHYSAVPGSLDAIIEHPQNYEGCVVQMTGIPSGAAMSIAEGGRRYITFFLVSEHTKKRFRYEGTLPWQEAKILYDQLNFAEKHHIMPEAVRVMLEGLFQNGKLELYRSDGPGKDVDLVKSTLNSQ